MKRLTIITNTLTSFGGGEKWALEIATRLKGRFNITILSPIAKKSIERMSMDEIRRVYNLEGIMVESIDSAGIPSKAFGADKYLMVFPKLRGMRNITSAIKGSDTIYLLSFNPFILSYAVAMARLYKKKLILGVHNPTFYKLFDRSQVIRHRGVSKLFLSVLRQVKHFHVLTNEDKKLVESNFPGAQAHLIPLFIYQKPRVSINTREFIALLVGNLEMSQKGIDLLQRIVDTTLQKNNKIVFHVVGKGGRGEEIARSLEKRHSVNFKWLGFASDSDLDRERRLSSLAISTSRYETFPAVLLDASSYGLPIVSFKIKGANIVVKDKFQGSLVKPFDIKAFSNSILNAYETWRKDGAAYKRLRKRIANTAVRRFGEKRVIGQLLKVME